MSAAFSSLHPTLQGIIAGRLGWDDLRPVQEEACRAAAEGRDLLVVAGTAGGKTEAALIPVIDAVLKGGLPGVACLCLSPLKALINDQEERLLEICTPAGISVAKWHGDVGKGERSWSGGDPPHVLVTTPESLEVILLDSSLRPDLVRLRFVVVDEVHAFAADLRGVQIRFLLDRLDRLAGRPLQRIGLSATVGNPDEILAWLSGPGRKAGLVASPVRPGKKQFTFTIVSGKEEQAAAVAGLVAGRRALVFVQSRSEAERLAAALEGRVDRLSVHHSSLSAAMRRQAEESLSTSSSCVICTSTLELGIDIGGLDLVVQVGPPASVSSFLQRLGRTGRRGGPARMAFVLGSDLDLLLAAGTIEAAARRKVEPLRPPTLPYTVYIQQLLLALVGAGRLPRRSLLSSLSSSPAFAGISPDDAEAIVDHLLSTGHLAADGPFLMPGPAAERDFSRSHWSDLLSVFATGAAFRALTPEGDEVGDLDARFVAGGAGTVCTLGGRRWRIIALDQAHRIATVVSEGRGARTSDRRPFWSGTGAPMSPVIARSVQGILARGRSSLPLTNREQAAIRGIASEIGAGIPTEGFFVTECSEGIFVLSCYGGRFNRMLASLLAQVLGDGPKIRACDLCLLVDGVTGPDPAGEVYDALCAVRNWPATAIAEALPLPEAADWKFGLLLPPSLFARMVAVDVHACDTFAAFLAAAPVHAGEETISGASTPDFR